MFPMRDHLEMAKMREIELMAMARREQQLREAGAYTDQVWSLGGVRRLWRRIFGRLNGARDHAESSLPQMKVYGR